MVGGFAPAPVRFTVAVSAIGADSSVLPSADTAVVLMVAEVGLLTV